jgi:hypothetical protein
LQRQKYKKYLKEQQNDAKNSLRHLRKPISGEEITGGFQAYRHPATL